MLIWIALAGLLSLTLIVLVRPLMAGGGRAVGGDDCEIYAAQLKEFEADRSRGLMAESDADAARAEIARRLLRSRGSAALGFGERRRGRMAAVGLLVFVPVFSLAAYLAAGTPGYGDMPLSARVAPLSDDGIATLLAQAEERLRQDPQDGRGWAVVAPVYQRLGRFAEAAVAYNKANAILGETAEFVRAEGESLTFAAGGEVTDAARALFERALVLEPGAIPPAIYLAISDRQRGDAVSAGERWQALLARSNGTEPWLNIARAELGRMSLGEAPAPDGAAMAAARSPAPALPLLEAPQPSPSEGPAQTPINNANVAPPPMVEAMVAQLATRLEQEGGSLNEWTQLVRSYMVLGRVEDAKSAVADGLAALSGTDRTMFENAPEVLEAKQAPRVQ
ncbi:MAG: c-type cytochrome biogenesis protein CcmI [Pseudomonadota bacterium]